MEKPSEIKTTNRKETGISSKKSIFNASPASILKLGLAIAQFEQSKFILLPKEIMIII